LRSLYESVMDAGGDAVATATIASACTAPRVHPSCWQCAALQLIANGMSVA
jgi:hypothetical protein